MLNIAVIGTGHLGRIHTKLWAYNPEVNLVGVYDIDEKTRLEVAQSFNCKAFKSLEETLDNCDAATIAVPTSLHYNIAMKCINKGIHCFIEKPITTTSKEAKNLIDEAQKNNVLIQVGHVERFNPALAALKDYNLNPMFIEAHRLAQFKPRAIDVSVILDLMIHDIDIVLALIKSPIEKIEANGVAVLTNNQDICNARLQFKNGAVANLTASRISAHPMRKMRIFQQNAYISIDFGFQNVEIFKLVDLNETSENDIPATMLGTIEAGLGNKKIVYEKPEIPELNAIEQEQIAFIKAIENKMPIAVSAEEATEALRIAEMIIEKISK